MKPEITTLAQLCARHKLLGKHLAMFHILSIVYWISAVFIDVWWAYTVAGVTSVLTLTNTVLHIINGKRIARLVKWEKETNIYLNELYDRTKWT